MKWNSPTARQRYDAFVAVAHEAIAGFDLDGTLSPIVDDPTQATIHPQAHAALLSLAPAIGSYAVITGRPARQAIALGDLDHLGAQLAEQNRELVVLGQYGNESWSATNRRIISPRPPRGLASFERELPDLLRRADAAAAWVEEKGLAVAIHTRRLPAPEDALSRLKPLVAAAAVKHDLAVEPGRNVLEVRATGMDKGVAIRQLVDDHRPAGFLFCGDDLGDLEAFHAVDQLRREGLAGLLVCSSSTEETGLQELADIVVDGPDGVIDLLNQLAASADLVR